ncbi:PIN domain-containing protein [bacterium]|nr:PIN domain-containing protein [bacterium]
MKSAVLDVSVTAWGEGKLDVRVPELWVHEMLNVLLSGWRRGRMSEELMSEAWAFVQRWPVVRLTIPSERMGRWRELAVRFGVSSYDAAYLELAERLHSPLFTFDKKLGRAAKVLGLSPD